jgi:putative transposase
MENLDFRGSGLSRRMNRLLTRFGLGQVTKKLAVLNELGMKVLKVDAAYTSQYCSSCGYVDAKNRKKQEEFVCLCCGYSRNADYNGSLAVKHFGERFSDRVFYGKAGRTAKLNLLLDDFIEKGFWRGRDCAAQSMKVNPYFKGRAIIAPT